jgi:hypothetical protein
MEASAGCSGRGLLGCELLSTPAASKKRFTQPSSANRAYTLVFPRRLSGLDVRDKVLHQRDTWGLDTWGTAITLFFFFLFFFGGGG